ncbi:MAG: tryptophan synthase subunit beta [Candidatus Sumerlaeia bacterium]|nr:tryptophan synthase subunit beta [Candidatus Sumerlaeia bacterium]
MSDSTATQLPHSTALPDAAGRFGGFGGRYVPETLMQTLIELEAAYRSVAFDDAFQAELARLLSEFAGRETPLTRARRYEHALGGRFRIYFKREDLLHTGAHKLNNTLGQALLAQRLGKRRIIAETGAGQHGVATATACALLGLECTVFMGEEDTRRQALNVTRMRLMGAKVQPVTSGTGTLKDATNEAMREWMSTCDDTHYIIGSCVGPHPFPMMVRDFQSVIGKEAKEQLAEREGRLPDHVVACVGGGSNAMGIFFPFYDEPSVRLWGAEAAGHGVASGLHAASIAAGQIGVFHGSRSFVLQTPDGQITPAHSISAGLDYPGIGPEHAFYADSGRATYLPIDDDEAIASLRRVSELEGIIPAIETAHATALLEKLAPRIADDAVVLVSLSGRGDKDVATLKALLDAEAES